jgi:hypothetical protein
VSELADVLKAAGAESRSALIGYLPVGYPDVPTSIDAMRAMVAGGADVIEIGGGGGACRGRGGGRDVILESHCEIWGFSIRC